ncbi:hypothetical protein ACIQGO_07980 [Streptomyces shenzhenensis]|uniref:hypothetical protein n=1 Tax=Streptomyces shenzhenensis TaxID=943815 RepID=UPI0037FDB273
MPDRPVPDADELARLRARVAALEAERGAHRRRHRARSFLAVLLVVLGCALAPLGVLAAWSARTVGDTDRYVDTVAPLAAEPAVRSAAATRVTDALMPHLDLDALLAGAAPADRPRLRQALGGLGGALEGAVRAYVHDEAEAVMASRAFQTFWTDANRRIHATVEKALTGHGGGAVHLRDNTVTIDLAPVIDQVKKRLVDSGLTVAQRIPAVHTDFTVAHSDDIGRARTYLRLLQLAGNWLPVIAVLLVAAGVLLAARRRRALVAGALGIAVTTLLLGIALTVFRSFYLDALPAGVSRPAAGAVYDTLTRFLRTTVRMVVALGVVVALAAWLTGPGRYASAVRRLWHAGLGAVRATAGRLGLRTGPVGPFTRRHRRWLTWVLVAAAVLAYLLWNRPTGWVVVGLTLTLLFALAVVDFLAAGGEGVEGETGEG